ncbi:MAG: hypothetical protein JWL90_3196, partial [Chthoniobacteraceae bacterium]|nr:hypothetical protein [Chthoniobacteraceae bacterium]
ALSAGKATGLGYVTIVENNAPGLGAAPVALHILRVVNPPVTGELKVIFSDNALDEKITIRHANDFAGDPDGLTFEWLYVPATTPTSPPLPGQPNAPNWLPLESGLGINDVTFEGAGVKTLADSWVICRYKGFTAGGYDGALPTAYAGDPSSTPNDRRAAFVPGWIKRVIEGINPFEARVRDFGAAPTQTYSSFITQAGSRYEGAVALNSDPNNLNNLGLISLYETVLQRGLGLSINGTPPQTNDAVNTALLLASTRISDFYMLLGNEAYADAQDPTIGFTSAGGEVGSLAPSVFAFANQLPSLLDEEITLLRGRDNSSAGVGAAPVYNRLFWNFTGGLEGEPVYVQNYGISDQNADGVINETDARKLFPQGHGDAWGHYLSAVKSSYKLLRHPRFTWTPRSETTLVGGVAIEVDYLDERKFASAAAARATAGAEIVGLTYRQRYVADPAGQWQGYKDSETARAWGVDEWAHRAGQGAYLDWLTANSILPAIHQHPLRDPSAPPPSGLQKIDRTTVTELEKIAAAYTKVQAQMDQADQGLNPVGIAPGSIPFDIDPALLSSGSGTHFEQIYERALGAMSNARRVFDYASESTNRLRQTQLSADAFAQESLEQEFDYKNRLIEIFGYPYAGDIGSGKLYPTGYTGPDLYHYNYVAVNNVSGNLIAPDAMFTAFFAPFGQEFRAPPGGASNATDFQSVVSHYFSSDLVTPETNVSPDLPVQFPVATAAAWSFSAPSTWGLRRAPGTLQMAIGDMVGAEAELRRGLVNYNNHLAGIQDQIDLLFARSGLQADNIQLLNKQRKTTIGLNAAIGTARAVSIAAAFAANLVEKIADSSAGALPTTVGLSNDVTAPIRGVIRLAGAIGYGTLTAAGNISEIAAQSLELGKEDVGLSTALEIQKNDYAFEIQEQLKVIEGMLREEIGLRLDLFTLQQSLSQAFSNYQSTLAEGQRVLEERLIYRRKVAGAVQLNRYQDLTFRNFRNDALQKYRAAFDLAARYTYLAATTYDFETVQLSSSATAGRRFLTDIVRERALGQFDGDGNPVNGVNGLSDPLARLKQNFDVLKGRLGINNPQIETGVFSLRKELYRLREESDEAWSDQLQTHRVANLWEVPEYRRFCRPFAPETAGAQPGLIVTFSTDITFGLNFFGQPLGGGDSSYDSSNYATKINSVGVWFENYDGQGLSTSPRVYLIPAGLDVLRAPDDMTLSTREFSVVDQAIPTPIPVGMNSLQNPSWIPVNDSLDARFDQSRQFSRFRAHHDGGFDTSELVGDTRLVGRSVWNTKWMLIIPGGTLLNDPGEGLDTFILGRKVLGGTNGTRDGNGIRDIKLFFESYSYSGN